MATSEHASGQLLLLVISTLLIAALELHPASAQQQYNNVPGYTCTGVSQTCSASAYYRTQGTNSTLNSTATRFNTTAAAIASASALNTTSSNALLPADTPLTIPLACGCYNGTYQALTTYTVLPGDTMVFIANNTFEGLVTYQAIMAANTTVVPSTMQIGTKLEIPVRCACPTSAQVANGTASLLSYAVYPNEDLTSIGKKFNVSAAVLESANMWPNTTVDAFSTVLVPIMGNGTGSNGGRAPPAPAPASAASRGFQAHLLGVVAVLAVQAFVF
jgi:LysM repeat protein